VFERRLIESYISEHGTDPVTGEVLTVEDLIDLRSARVVKPRPPTLTSIPSLLSVFQQEWDALALESYQLRESIAKLRVELSAALYNNDAAIRVIARLTKERDEARDALGKMSITERRSTTNGGGDAMQVDGTTLPESMGAKIDATREKYVLRDVWDCQHTNDGAGFRRHDGSDLYQKSGPCQKTSDSTARKSQCRWSGLGRPWLRTLYKTWSWLVDQTERAVYAR